MRGADSEFCSALTKSCHGDALIWIKSNLAAFVAGVAARYAVHLKLTLSPQEQQSSPFVATCALIFGLRQLCLSPSHSGVLPPAGTRQWGVVWRKLRNKTTFDEKHLPHTKHHLLHVKLWMRHFLILWAMQQFCPKKCLPWKYFNNCLLCSVAYYMNASDFSFI